MDAEMIDKKDEKYKEERKEKADEFEARHCAFLEKLRHLPANQKGERWELFSGYDQRENFIIELMETYKPGAYKKIEARLNNASIGAEENIAYWGKKKEFDSIVFMEVLKDAIESYTGINQEGEAYGFVTCIGLMYRQRAGKAAAKNTLEMKGISGLPNKKILSVIKLAKAAKKMWEKKYDELSQEQAMEQVIKEFIGEGKEKKEKELIGLVKALVFSEGIVTSMDKPVGEENSGDTLGDFLEDERDEYSLLVEQENNRFLWESFCQEMEERWEVIKSAKGLKEQERFKQYFTRDVLRELKQDEEGKPYLKEPAGNKKIYQMLKPKGDFLYHKMFYQRYLWRALVEKPNDLYDVYVLLLRSDFKFTDKILAEVMGKDKTAVSKGKRQYREMMDAIYSCCISN